MLEHYIGQYQTNDFVGGSFYNYVGAKKKQLLTTSDNDKRCRFR